MKYQEIANIITNSKSLNSCILNVFQLSLSPQQKLIFNYIPEGKNNAISCNEIGIITGLATKNISSQLNQLQDKHEGIKTIKYKNKLKYYI